MSTSDLNTLLRSFDPLHPQSGEPPQLTRGEALVERIVATPRSLESRKQATKPLRLLVIAGAVVLGLLVPAMAVGTGAFHLLDNEPAPPAVSKELGAPAFGLVQLTTSSGKIAALYRADVGSGECTYVRIIDSSTKRPGLSSALCNPKPDAQRPISRFSQAWQRVDGTSLELMMGKVSGDVSSVEVVFRNGAIASVPLSQGYFLYELSSAPPALAVTAKDNSGRVVDRRTIENVKPPAGS